MATQRHLRNAPIREGVVDIKFEPPVSLELLEVFAESVQGAFGQASRLWQQSLGIEVKQGELATVNAPEGTVVGFRLQADRHVLMVRVNGFTYSRLPPYENWEQLRDSAKAIWKQFVASVKPETVTRMAVRYINVLPLPITTEEFSVFLTAAPTIPQALPQGLASFLQQVVMIDPIENRQAIVTQALEDSQSRVANMVNIILDIDAFRLQRLATHDDAVWTSLDNLRSFKNAIFFDHITEKTAELFQ